MKKYNTVNTTRTTNDTFFFKKKWQIFFDVGFKFGLHFNYLVEKIEYSFLKLYMYRSILCCG